MATFYRYDAAILGSQSSQGVNGAAVDYRFAPSGNWSYTGSNTSFIVEEARDSNTRFDGDRTNEEISPNFQIGASRAQTVEVDGSDRQVIWDYTFEVSNDTGTWRVAVIDVDLDNSDVIEAGAENGYFLIFPDGMPPEGVNLTVGAIVENDNATSHAGLDATVVCFAAGTLIETQSGPKAIETLSVGDMVLTRDAGYQPLRWLGKTAAAAQGELAPIVITKGSLGTTDDLVVSPQHAILIEDWRAELLYGEPDVLIRARDLLSHDGVYRKPGGIITYCHMLFDAHQLVKAGGIWSESLYPGEMTRGMVAPETRQEIETLFPDLKGYGPKSARCLRRYEAACLTA